MHLECYLTLRYQFIWFGWARVWYSTVTKITLTPLGKTFVNAVWDPWLSSPIQVTAGNRKKESTFLEQEIGPRDDLRGSKRDVVYLGWLIAPLYWGLGGGGGGLGGTYQLCTWSLNQLWRSNSIFNLWAIYYTWCWILTKPFWWRRRHQERLWVMDKVKR